MLRKIISVLLVLLLVRCGSPALAWTKEEVAAAVGDTFSDWQDERIVRYYSRGQKNYVSVTLLRIRDHMLERKQAIVALEDCGDREIPWQVEDFSPIPLTAWAEEQLAMQPLGEVFSFHVVKEEYQQDITTLFAAEEGEIEKLLLFDNAVLAVIRAASGGAYLALRMWNGEDYAPAMTTQPCAELWVNWVHSGMLEIEFCTEDIEGVFDLCEDGHYRLTAVCPGDQYYFIHEDGSVFTWDYNEETEEESLIEVDQISFSCELAGFDFAWLDAWALLWQE